MGSNAFDRRLTLLRKTTTKGAMGTPGVEGFAEFGKVWASKVDVSDGERFAGGGVSAVVETRFRVHLSTKTASLTGADRVECAGRTYGIVGVKEVEEGRERLIEISAKAQR